MLEIARFHPQIVHFVVALLIVGVGLRVVSLIPLPERFRFVSPAATLLIVLGALASLLAVHSGLQAHGPAERVPGARSAVTEHEEWGERARNVFLIVGAVELIALALPSQQWRRGVHVATALGGLVGGWVLYEAAEHGGDLVYSYAGGVGLRTGDSADVRRLLVAGLYHEATQAGRAGRADEATRLLEELSRQMPGDPDVELLVIDGRLRYAKDTTGVLAALDAFPVPEGNRRVAQRVALLRVDALELMGLRDSARAIVMQLLEQVPNNTRFKERLESLK